MGAACSERKLDAGDPNICCSDNRQSKATLAEMFAEYQPQSKNDSRREHIESAKGRRQREDEGDADGLAGFAADDVKQRVARTRRQAEGEKRAVPFVLTSPRTPEGAQVGSGRRVAARSEGAALRRRAVVAEAGAEARENSESDASPKERAERDNAKASAPAAAKGRRKPPDHAGSAAGKCSPRPRQPPLACDAAAAVPPPTEAAASGGAERGPPDEMAFDEVDDGGEPALGDGAVAGTPAALSPSVALSPSFVRLPEDSRSDGEEGLVEGRAAEAPPVHSPRAGGAPSGGDSAAAGRRGKTAVPAAAADQRSEVEARTSECREKEDVLSTPITFLEVVNWVNTLPLDEEVLKASGEDEVASTKGGCLGLRRAAPSIPGLNRRCQRDMDIVLLLTSTEFDPDDPTHFRMLRTAYTSLTGVKACPAVGRHWEVLGFEHEDPRSDLSVSGRLLLVFHIFSCCTNHFDVLLSAYTLAHGEDHGFPLASVCINLTQMVLQSLNEGKLSRLCNASDKDVLDMTCNIFAGSLFYFCARWGSNKRTAGDMEAALKEVRRALETRPAKLLQGLAKGAEALKQQANAAKLDATDFDFHELAPVKGGALPGPDVPKRRRGLGAYGWRLRRRVSAKEPRGEGGETPSPLLRESE